MSAEILRDAAAQMRQTADANRCPCDESRCEDNWYSNFLASVAIWLEFEANHFDQWHGARAACRDLDQGGEEDELGRSCGCAYKDCYEHGKWHNCTHGAPDLTAALAVANAYLES